MRNPIDADPMDAVFNLFTSFGYFDNENDDKKVFQSVYNALKPEDICTGLPERGVW